MSRATSGSPAPHSALSLRMRSTLLALFLFAGCRNDCQDLCIEIAQFSEDECGLSFSRDGVDQCISDYNLRATDREFRAQCAESPSVADEWTCDEIDEYFKASADETDTGT